MPYALFDRERRIGAVLPSVAEVWKEALRAGLIGDVPVADQAPGQVLPAGYHVEQVPPEPDREPRT